VRHDDVEAGLGRHRPRDRRADRPRVQGRLATEHLGRDREVERDDLVDDQRDDAMRRGTGRRAAEGRDRAMRRGSCRRDAAGCDTERDDAMGRGTGRR